MWGRVSCKSARPGYMDPQAMLSAAGPQAAKSERGRGMESKAGEEFLLNRRSFFNGEQ